MGRDGRRGRWICSWFCVLNQSRTSIDMWTDQVTTKLFAEDPPEGTWHRLGVFEHYERKRSWNSRLIRSLSFTISLFWTLPARVGRGGGCNSRLREHI